MSSCKKISKTVITDCFKGEGAITTEIIPVDDFTGINLLISNDIIVTQGAVQKVEVTGHSNIIKKLKTSVVDNIWQIGLQDGCYNDYELSINITVPDINTLKLSGYGNIYVNEFTGKNEKLTLDVSGKGKLQLKNFKDFTTLESSISGGGIIDLDGFNGATVFNISLSGAGRFSSHKYIYVERLNLTNSGSGYFSGYQITGYKCVVNITGPGECELTAKNSLDVKINGSGYVFYKGTPIITQQISGTGKVINAN
jgi:hypothetical protein